MCVRKNTKNAKKRQNKQIMLAFFKNKKIGAKLIFFASKF